MQGRQSGVAEGELPTCIRRMIAGMHHAGRLDAAILRDIVDEAAVDFDALAPLNSYDHDPVLSYGRRCLWQAEHMGIYLMSWMPGDFTALHGHGHAEWGVVIFGGDTTHRSYRVRAAAVARRSADTIPAGETLGVCTADYYHAMGNHGSAPFMTLHIYGAYEHVGPSTDDARVFELEKDCISITGGSAYVNMPTDLRKSCRPGVRADDETCADYLACIRPYYDRIGVVPA